VASKKNNLLIVPFSDILFLVIYKLGKEYLVNLAQGTFILFPKTI
jgi:hypothetical protein